MNINVFFFNEISTDNDWTFEIWGLNEPMKASRFILIILFRKFKIVNEKSLTQNYKYQNVFLY